MFAADKLDNARAVLADLRQHGDALWEQFTGGKAGSLWYYRALVNAFGEALIRWAHAARRDGCGDLERYPPG